MLWPPAHWDSRLCCNLCWSSLSNFLPVSWHIVKLIPLFWRCLDYFISTYPQVSRRISKAGPKFKFQYNIRDETLCLRNSSCIAFCEPLHQAKCSIRSSYFSGFGRTRATRSSDQHFWSSKPLESWPNYSALRICEYPDVTLSPSRKLARGGDLWILTPHNSQAVNAERYKKEVNPQAFESASPSRLRYPVSSHQSIITSLFKPFLS